MCVSPPFWHTQYVNNPAFTYCASPMVLCNIWITQAGLFICVHHHHSGVHSMWRLGYLHICVCHHHGGDAHIWMTQAGLFILCTPPFWCASMWRLGYLHICCVTTMVVTHTYVKAGLFVCVYQNGGVHSTVHTTILGYTHMNNPDILVHTTILTTHRNNPAFTYLHTTMVVCTHMNNPAWVTYLHTTMSVSHME